MTQQPGPADARGGGQFWRARNFMLFFVATSASTLGSAMVSVALTFAVLSHGHSAMILGVVLAAQAAPVVVLMVPAGAVADLWPRRSLMVGADLLRCASQGLTAVLMAGAHPSVAALVALVALVGIGNAFYGPAESGLIPVLARPEDLRRVNSLLSLSGSITAILGPSLGGMLVAVGSAPIAIGCDALTYAVSATCLSFMRTMRPTRRAATPFHTHLLTGWREFHRRRWLILMTAQYGILNLAAFAPFLILGPVSLAGTPHGARSWGIISSAVGIGGIVGGVIILFWRASRPLILYELAASALIVPLFLLARQAPVPVVALGGIAFGAGMVILNLVAQTTIQRQVPEEALSRINALFGLVAQGLTPLSYAMCGFLARSVGTKPVLVAGCVVVGASVVVLLMCRETWQLRDVPA